MGTPQITIATSLRKTFTPWGTESPSPSLRSRMAPWRRTRTGSPTSRCIPPDLDIWTVEPDNFNDQLGPDSPAWQLWQLLFDKLEGAGHSGRGVTAGKLLHGKRPRLIPIFDRERIGTLLGVTQADIWEAMWCAMRTTQIRSRVQDIQEEVSEAKDLSLLRVLDVVVWMSSED